MRYTFDSGVPALKRAGTPSQKTVPHTKIKRETGSPVNLLRGP
ncbi:hypothetical protein MiSe_18760 [Microseira wollei NIES-4236]|uniref:Transposase n=1 Tax=Microseira wollei NIES-4236 TaxID=2530354 RepID=A0AAV3X6Z4_9CYAN|nr:hypothetical protein MiSe_18760 [Microseira wollei NIES-4236]